jgi:hypothetical protein
LGGGSFGLLGLGFGRLRRTGLSLRLSRARLGRRLLWFRWLRLRRALLGLGALRLRLSALLRLLLFFLLAVCGDCRQEQCSGRDRCFR